MMHGQKNIKLCHSYIQSSSMRWSFGFETGRSHQELKYYFRKSARNIECFGFWTESRNNCFWWLCYSVINVESGFNSRQRRENFPVESVQTTATLFCWVHRKENDRDVKLNTEFHVVLRFKIFGALPPLPIRLHLWFFYNHTFKWRGNILQGRRWCNLASGLVWVTPIA